MRNVHAEEQRLLVLPDGGDIARPHLQLVPGQLFPTLMGG